MKKVALNVAAEGDVEKAIRYYLIEAGRDISNKFLLAFLQALEHISEFPLTGSTKYGDAIKVNALRSWHLKKFPYSVFYVVRDDEIEVSRVLHQHSDIPAHLQSDELN